MATGLYYMQLVAMLALSNVNPVVANTIKRVVILLACVIFFRTPMTPPRRSAIAIAGGYVYSSPRTAEDHGQARRQQVSRTRDDAAAPPASSPCALLPVHWGW